MKSRVPDRRVVVCNRAPLVPSGAYVVYWMIAQRRVGWNFALERAVEYAKAWNKPLVIFEALRSDYRWASDRLHRFVLQGMADTKARLADGRVAYYPYVEPERGADHGLLNALATQAGVIVTDDFPTFFLPRMVDYAARHLPVRLEKVDSNGLLPIRATQQVFSRAFDFRRYLQKQLAPHLAEFPLADPLARLAIPPIGKALSTIQKKWPPASEALLAATPAALGKLPIDHTVGPARQSGGAAAAGRALDDFLARKLSRYATDRNEPEEEVASGFSPYLHFGQLSVHEIFSHLAEQEQWDAAQMPGKTGGNREAWWGMSAEAESFLDELITWREIGYNFCTHVRGYDQYPSLPAWARTTLAEHAHDRRPFLYSLAEFAAADTHDPLWNAAQRQLVREGRMHNYLRMLWGKKILEWTASPEEALAVMIELNNKYALDGRNPNSYSGICWVLGRYDRAWGPERPIYGKIRYMSSDNTARKLHVAGYVERYSK